MTKATNKIIFDSIKLWVLLAALTSFLEIYSKPAQWKERSALEIDSTQTPETDAKKDSPEKKPDLKKETDKKEKIDEKQESKENKEIKKEPTTEDEPEDPNEFGKISLNFQEANLSNLINYMADLKNMSLIPSNETNDVKVSLNMNNLVSKEEAWEVFTTLLDFCGFCIIKIEPEPLCKVIRKDARLIEPHPVYMGIPAEKLPDSAQTVRYITFLKNLAPGEVENLIKNFLDPKAQVISQPSMNALIITEKASSIKYAMGIVNQLDNSGIKEACQVLRLDKSTASDVKKFMDELIKKPETSSLARLLGQQSEGCADYFPGNVKLVAEDRTNSLIMLGTPASLKKIETFIKEYFEGNWKTRTPFFPYECQYVESDHIKSILDEVLSAESNSSRGQSSRGGAKNLGGVKIESDKYSNKLIIYSQDPTDLELVKEIIADLDKPQPMIALETLIVEVTQEDKRQLGGQVRNKSHGTPIPGVDFQGGTLGPIETKTAGGDTVSILGNLMAKVKSANIGETILTFGDGTKEPVWAAFKALKTMGNTNVIANPFVTVANREKATFTVGEERRIVGEKGQGDSNAFAGYIPVQASTKLSFVPQISPDGLISLDITIQISDFLDNLGNRTSKDLSTNVTMSDGQILVLGGFIKTKYLESKAKTPIFGDIPIFGWLAKNKRRDSFKNYIFIFVSPTISKPRSLPGSGLYTKMKLHDASKIVDQSTETNRTTDPIHNMFFSSSELTSHKVVDFANARYQPTTVDMHRDPLYRGKEIFFDNTKRISSSESEQIPVGDDTVTLTKIDSKTVDQTIENDSIKLAVDESPKDKKTKIVKSKTTPKSEKSTKTAKTEQKNNKGSIRISKMPKIDQNAVENEKLAKQESTKTIEFKEKPVLKPEKEEELESDNDFEKMILKNAKSEPIEKSDFGIKLTKQNRPESIIIKAKTDAKIDESTDYEFEPSLDDIFKKDSHKKRSKLDFSELEEDFLSPEDERIVRAKKFSKRFEKDQENTDSSTIFDKIDDFDIKMGARIAKNKQRKSKNDSKPNETTAQTEGTLEENEPLIEETSENIKIKSKREDKFKKLLAKNRSWKDSDSSEDLDS